MSVQEWPAKRALMAVSCRGDKSAGLGSFCSFADWVGHCGVFSGIWGRLMGSIWRLRSSVLVGGMREGSGCSAYLTTGVGRVGSVGSFCALPFSSGTVEHRG